MSVPDWERLDYDRSHILSSPQYYIVAMRTNEEATEDSLIAMLLQL